MVLSQDDNHPYWYARIIGIFHVMVVHKGCDSTLHEPQKMEFLFFRWFGYDSDDVGGWKARKLHQIGFIDSSNSLEGFGFINPADVVRAVHLIPCFSLSHTKELLPHSIARSALEQDEDWVRYYVNM
jgi:hypothetical protein